MTNEEARRILLDIADQMPSDECADWIDAISLGIKAIDAQLSEDCISRQAVLDYIDKMPSVLTSDGRRMVRRRALEEYISDTLPSVTPQTPKGKWIEYKVDIAPQGI